MFEHYAQVQEAGRLFDGVGELERVRTQDILSRHLPAPPATVLDIGGAAGVHALWLAQRGFAVHLFDPVQALKEAHRLLQPGGRLFAATISRFASLIDGLSRDLVSDPVFVEILTQDLRNGRHRV